MNNFILIRPTPVAVWSKAPTDSHFSDTGVLGSNPARNTRGKPYVINEVLQFVFISLSVGLQS
jgi:hypothetical protein